MLYRNRVEQNHDSGPFGLLIREVAIKPEEFESVDYLKAPESIEDISTSYHKMYSEDLLELFQENTRPCIVTFADIGQKPDALHKAIYYLYAKKGNEDLIACNTCFDGEGRIIPPEQIVRVEYLR